MSYDKLILAPGGTPRRLPIEGAQLENVYTFRTIDDAKKVDAGMYSVLNCDHKMILYDGCATSGEGRQTNGGFW
jgi:NADH dehydrogenase FAD-containing subunit